MNKKSMVSIATIAIIVILIMISPLLVFRIYDHHLLSETYQVEKPKSKIDPDISKIYLVGAIHNQYGSDNSYNAFWRLNQEQGNTKINFNDMVEELNQIILLLKPIGVIIPTDKINEIAQQSIFFTVMENATIFRTAIHIDELTIVLDFNQYKKKITNLVLETTTVLNNDDPKIKEFLRKYIEYLGLHIIEDWVFSGNNAVSKSGDLRISFSEYRLKSGKQKLSCQVLPNSLS